MSKAGYGELRRWYQYVNGEPAMCLAPMVARQKKNAFVIGLSSAHRYTEPLYMLRQCGVIIDLFDLGWSSKRCADIASFIEDGLDDLVHLPPPEREGSEVIGEGSLMIGDTKMGFEVTADDYRKATADGATIA